MGELIPDKTAVSPHDEVARSLEEQALVRALRQLPYRWRRVVVMRHGLFGEPERSLDQLTAVFRIQREQVRQVQLRAEAALREQLEYEGLAEEAA